ncbi:hypothetical protein F511_39704 [Dorcoceras hygrometricum]|uniref:Uncharacterized protein n=1 Tax=Dorcoceras hygrometricum TaxID=472368 RepID=A0A2Z7DFI7_9LAMI|nr:hypothetical protein F511_39704 [Dorcoceras hygrometricum]
MARYNMYITGTLNTHEAPPTDSSLGPAVYLKSLQWPNTQPKQPQRKKNRGQTSVRRAINNNYQIRHATYHVVQCMNGYNQSSELKAHQLCWNKKCSGHNACDCMGAIPSAHTHYLKHNTNSIHWRPKLMSAWVLLTRIIAEKQLDGPRNRINKQIGVQKGDKDSRFVSGSSDINILRLPFFLLGGITRRFADYRPSATNRSHKQHLYELLDTSQSNTQTQLLIVYNTCIFFELLHTASSLQTQ